MHKQIKKHNMCIKNPHRMRVYYNISERPGEGVFQIPW